MDAAVLFNTTLLLELILERAARDFAPADRTAVYSACMAHGIVPGLVGSALALATPPSSPASVPLAVDAQRQRFQAALNALHILQRAILPGFTAALLQTPRGFWSTLLRL